jgi:hypothetical protein
LYGIECSLAASLPSIRFSKSHFYEKFSQVDEIKQSEKGKEYNHLVRYPEESLDSSVGTATGYGQDGRGKFSFSSYHPCRFWDTLTVPSNGYW